MAKQNYSVTSRYFAEQQPVEIRRSNEFFTIRGRPFHRLAFGQPAAKKEVTSWDLAEWIKSTVPPNAIFFPDTNFFSRPMGRLIWEALLTRRIAIPPLIAKEIEPWLNSPFNNHRIRDVVLDARQNNPSAWLQQVVDFNHREGLRSRIIFPQLDKHFTDHAYSHYHNLLAVRRLIGLEIAQELEIETGHRPTTDEVLVEITRRHGQRGFRVAREAVEKGVKANFLADEQMVVMAALTAICTGYETIILTWDTAIQEQFLKLWHLLDCDYIAHCCGEWASQGTNLDNFNFIEGPETCCEFWIGSPIRTYSVTRDSLEKAVLPTKFTPMCSGLLVIGGEMKRMVFTPESFCAEREMDSLLQQKSVNGKNTPHFGNLDCVVTSRQVDGESATVVSLLQPRVIQSCSMSVSAIDLNGALKTNESIYRIDPAEPGKH